MNETILMNFLTVLVFVCLLFMVIKRFGLKLFKTDKYLLETVYVNRQTLKSFFQNEKSRLSLLFTILFVLFLIFGKYIPLPGVDLEAYKSTFMANFRPANIFCIGVMPFLSANALLILFVALIPPLRRFLRDSLNRNKITSVIVYVLTLIMCIVYTKGIASWLQNPMSFDGTQMVFFTGLKFTILVMFSMTAGTMLLLWLAGRINAFGIGHGISLIMLTGLGTRLILYLSRMYSNTQNHFTSSKILLSLFLIVFQMYLCFWILRVRRKIVIENIENKKTTSLLLSINQAGIFPFIITSSIMAWILVLIKFLCNGSGIFSMIFSQGYHITFSISVVIISIGYGKIAFNPKYVAKRLKENGLKIRGEKIEEDKFFLARLLNKFNLVWAGILILPYFLTRICKLSYYISLVDFLVIAAVVLGYIKTNLKYSEKREIFVHTELGEMLVAKAYLETSGIKAYLDNKESYGRIYGYFVGPLAVKKLLVNPEDYEKASLLMKEYKKAGLGAKEIPNF